MWPYPNPPLLSTDEITPGMLSPSVEVPHIHQVQEIVQRLEMIQQRGAKKVQMLEDITYSRLTELGLFYLMKRRPQSQQSYHEQVPRDAAKSPSLGIFMACLDKATADSECWQ